MQNKKGIGYFYTLMLGTVIIILVLALATPAKEFKDLARNETMEAGENGLNCTNPNLDIYGEANCIAIDVIYYLVIGGGLLVGVGVIGAKIIWG